MKIMLALARMERRRMSKHGGAQRPVRSIAALGRVDFAAMVRFNLLGELRLEIDGRYVELPASRKARLLLVMLALERRPQRAGRPAVA